MSVMLSIENWGGLCHCEQSSACCVLLELCWGLLGVEGGLML